MTKVINYYDGHHTVNFLFTTDLLTQLSTMQPYIKSFNKISINDVESVGGKNASLGEMFNKLSSKGKAAAIITNKGGRTSHASIVAREQGVPAVVGCNDATTAIKDGEIITVSCCEGSIGYIYEGELNFVKNEIDISQIEKPVSTEVMLILADPDKAFQLSFYPNDGVGLLRLEFIITHFIQAHPMALVNFDKVTDETAKQKIEKLTQNYPDKKQFFIDKLSQGVATIAAAFYPKDVIVRMSDLKQTSMQILLEGKILNRKKKTRCLASGARQDIIMIYTKKVLNWNARQ